MNLTANTGFESVGGIAFFILEMVSKTFHANSGQGERRTMHMRPYQLSSKRCEKADREVEDRVDSGMEVP